MKRYFPVLSIASSDSSGGAGIQADIKTISAIGCYAMTAITAITAQNTTGIDGFQSISPEMVERQIDMVCRDISPLAVKTGMLFSSEIAESVAKTLVKYQTPNIVIDPVIATTLGAEFIDENAIATIVTRLFPISTLVTPTPNEAIELTGETDPQIQVRRLREMGCGNILLKGGDADSGMVKTDYLVLEDSDDLIELNADMVHTNNTRGTGCTLSSAIASYLALGLDVFDAVCKGKIYVTRALTAGSNVHCGEGHGPINHLFEPRRMKLY